MAFLASLSSEADSRLFIAINKPPTLTRGRQSSARIFNLATALAVTTSASSRWFCAYSSARACSAFAFFKPNLAISSFKKAILLFNASIIVTSKLSNTIALGIEGNPAPAPTSTSLICLLGSKASDKVKES